MATVMERDTLPAERPGRLRLTVEDDADGWRLAATDAKDGLRLRHAFRDYLEAYGDPACDFAAAESVYGELVGNCARHAPGPVHIEFRWRDSTLSVVDARDRLQLWPFSEDDTAAELTYHAYAIVSALTARVFVTREGSGTRASVVLPVMRAER